MELKDLYEKVRTTCSRWRDAIAGVVKKVTCPPDASLLAGPVLDLTRSKAELIAENTFLRQQVIVLQRSVKRPKFRNRDRLVMVLLARLNARWRSALLLVQPKTLLGWHRRLFRLIWKRKSRPKRVQETIPQETIDLIKKMARENALWGAEKIRGELLKLEIHVCKRTIQKYMVKSGRPRPDGQKWKTFLDDHSNEIWACDFLQAFDLFFRPVFMFFIVAHHNREVVHAAVTRHPTREWTAQQLREATPFGAGPKYLIRDNDDKFGAVFDGVAKGAGIEIRKTPIKTPQANAICERFLGSVRRECLDHVLILSEKHLRRIGASYVDYFNGGRPHQGIEQRVPRLVEREAAGEGGGRVIAFPVLGGLHHDYRRAA